MKYVKILNLGHPSIPNLLKGQVRVDEKIDGSQFRFGLDQNREFFFGSKNKNMTFDAWEALFDKAIPQMERVEPIIKHKAHSPITFVAEYLQVKKHGVLDYNRVPKNHLILFEVISQDGFGDYVNVEYWADALGFEAVPMLWEGPGEELNYDKFQELLKTESVLGGTIPEGLVIKNYSEQIFFGDTVQPCFGKYVREEYKERHHKESHKFNPRQNLDAWIATFNSERRWEKAIAHLKDDGRLEGSPRDIGALIKEVQTDVIEEEAEVIKKELFKMFKDQIKRRAVKGLPEFYKKKLAEQQFNENL